MMSFLRLRTWIGLIVLYTSGALRGTSTYGDSEWIKAIHKDMAKSEQKPKLIEKVSTDTDFVGSGARQMRHKIYFGLRAYRDRRSVLQQRQERDDIMHAKCHDGSNDKRCKNKCNLECVSGCDIQTGNCRDCPPGSYGHRCRQNCSTNCGESNGVVECNMSSGFCLNGCKQGYWGDFCQNSCSSCVNSSCYFEDGTCLYGCRDGFYGIGNKCNMNCSNNCNNNVCNMSGFCTDGCNPGFTGSTCNLTCDWNCKECSQINGTCFKEDTDMNCSHCVTKPTLFLEIVGYGSFGVVLLLILILFVIVFCQRMGICRLSINFSCLIGSCPGLGKGPEKYGYSANPLEMVELTPL